MKNFTFRLRSLVGVFTLCLSGLVSAAHADGLQVELKALKIVVEAGEEKRVPADVAAPGDLVEYRAVYTNSGAAPLKDVRPEIPVPAGLVLVPGADKPAAPEVLVTGKGYVASPALDASGQPVAAELLRALRWAPETLPAGASREVVLRAVVSTR